MRDTSWSWLISGLVVYVVLGLRLAALWLGRHVRCCPGAHTKRTQTVPRAYDVSVRKPRALLYMILGGIAWAVMQWTI